MPAAAVLKVLVVDDQNSVRQMTRMTLEQIGIRQIHEAENGRDAMGTASLQPLDLIISDFNMPEMDGLALLRAVRGHPAARKIPFILLTGRGDRELVVKGGTGRCEQLSHQAVHPRYFAAKNRAGDGQVVVMTDQADDACACTSMKSRHSPSRPRWCCARRSCGSKGPFLRWPKTGQRQWRIRRDVSGLRSIVGGSAPNRRGEAAKRSHA